MKIWIGGLLSGMIFALNAQQAPGWSRGQQQLPVTWEECRRRSPQALQAEGYRLDNDTAFSVGIRDPHTAVIMCNPAPEAKTWVNIVVASTGPGGAESRQRLQARMEGANPGTTTTTPPVTQPSACTMAGKWQQKSEGVGTSTWDIDASGQAVETGSGIRTRASLNGRTIQINWAAPSGYAGTYEWTLDATCNAGAGSLMFTRGGSGNHRSTVTRIGSASDGVISAGTTGLFNASGGCRVSGRWTHTTDGVGTTGWDIAANGQATEFGGSATGTATVTGSALRITWAAPSGYQGYYEWNLNSTCTSGLGTLVFTRGANGTHRSSVTRN